MGFFGACCSSFHINHYSFFVGTLSKQVMSTKSKEDNSDASRNSNDLSKNPFAALFPSLQHAEEYVKSVKTGIYLEKTGKNTSGEFSQQTSNEWQDRAQIINDFLQRAFLFTVISGNNFISVNQLIIHSFIHSFITLMFLAC